MQHTPPLPTGQAEQGTRTDMHARGSFDTTAVDLRVLFVRVSVCLSSVAWVGLHSPPPPLFSPLLCVDGHLLSPSPCLTACAGTDRWVGDGFSTGMEDSERARVVCG
mmetsp:Transcript_9475/g.27276  ORF Transcript_9475/g.27276 Transcript_9475/m.27276 type:complete len:107 (-) Transcript_9475:167-487(-)